MRRTPALTSAARESFEQEILERGSWCLIETVPRIALETGLTDDQVRDSIFSKQAEAWRRTFVERLIGRRSHASS